MNARRVWSGVWLACLLAVCAAPACRAQTDFDLRGTPEGPWLLKHYLGADSVVVQSAGTVRAYATPEWEPEAKGGAAAARDVLPEIAAMLGISQHALAPVWIIVSPGGGSLAREAPSWSAAIAQPDRHLIVLSGPALRGGRAGLSETVAHEVAHLALHARLGTIGWVPRWLDEGVAMYVAGAVGWRDRLWALGRGPVRLGELVDQFPRDDQTARFAYLESEAAVRRLVARGSLAPLFDRLEAGAEFDDAFKAVYGESAREFADHVHAEVANRWRWLAAFGSAASVGGFMAFLAIVAAARTRLRNRRRMGEWAVAESLAPPEDESEIAPDGADDTPADSPR